LLGNGGVVKVLDMGLARLEPGGFGEQPSSDLTHTGAVMGTPAYMAPEQPLDPHAADVRADADSPGCTLYYLLTGRLPCQHASMAQVLLKHQLEEPVGLEQLRPEVPTELVAIVRRMMAKRPEDRYQTAAEVAEALASFGGRDGAPPTESILELL